MPNIYGNSEIWGNLLVTGSFSILGSASTISTTSLVVSDTIIALGHSQSGSPILDEGFMFTRGTGLTQAFIWDESDDTFALIGTNDDHTLIGDIAIDSYSKLRTAGLTTSDITIISGAQNGYYLKSNASGNATWANIPGGLTGSGTSNYVPYWTNSNTLSSTSSIYDTGSNVGIGTSSPSSVLNVVGDSIFRTSTLTTGTTPAFRFFDGVTTPTDTTTIKSVYKEFRPTTTSSSTVVGDGTLLYPNVTSSSSANFYAKANLTLYTGDLTLLTDSESLTSEINVIQIQTSTGTYNGTVKSSNSVLRNITAGGTIDKYVGYWMNGFDVNLTHNGTTNEMYGFYMEDQSGRSGNIPSTSNRWGVYIEDAGKNYFAGQVGIGVTPSSYKLEVSGTVSTTGFKMTNGASSGYILQSDASGNATWTSTTSSSANFANTDLTFTGNRTHELSGWDLVIGQGATQTIGMYNGFSTQITYENSIWEINDNYQQFDVAGTNSLVLLATEAVFNDGGKNYDFRVEGDTNANLFFVDASADSIGIGTNTPSYRFEVSGTVSTTGFRMTNGATNGYFLKSNASGVASWAQISASDISGLPGGLTGSGTTNYIPRWTSSSVLSSTSSIYDDGSNIGILTTSPVATLDVRGSVVFNNSAGSFNFTVKGNGDATLFATNGTSNVAGVGGYSSNAKFTVANTSTSHLTSLYVQNTNGSASGTNYGAQILNTTTTTGHNYGLYVNAENGSSANYGVVVQNGTSIFNNSGNDYDFVVKGLTDNNLFSVNASHDNIGIGSTLGFMATIPSTKMLITQNGATTSTNQGLLILTGNAYRNYGINIGIGASLVSNLGDIGVGSSITSTIASTSYTYYGNNSGTASTAYGLYQSIDSTGTTNYGLYIDSSAATTNYGIVVNRGTSVFNEGSDIDTDFRIESNGKTHMFFVDSSADSIGINNSSPDAYLHIGAGSTTIAPVKLTTGNLLTSAEAGALEYNNPLLYFTNGDNRTKVPLVLSSYTTTTSSATFDTTLGNAIPGLILAAGRKYEIDIHMPVAFASTAGGKIKLDYTASLTMVTGYSMTLDETTDSIITVNRYKDTDTAFDATEYNSTADLEGVFIFKGWLDVNTSGVLSVQFAQSASTANTAYVMPGSWIKATVIS